MKKLIPIQNFSDIITNSSSEVFITLDNEFNENFLKSLGVSYIKFESLDDVRNYIKEHGAWDIDEVLDCNPYANQDWFIETLLEYHSEDAIWDFFKPVYNNLVGKLFIYEDRDYFYNKLDTQEKYKTFNNIKI